jgi:tetratricopeptide (TPR) repeat protein
MTILIIVTLVIVGFLFPPVLLAYAGFGIYFVASHKSRRRQAVESRVKKMVSSGKESAVFADLFFESARSYAIENGANAPEKNAASTQIIVDGRSYFVVFSRATTGGTAITVEDAATVKRRVFDEPMAHIRNTASQKDVPASKGKHAVSTVGGSLFNVNNRPVQPDGYDEGKRLFELGVAAAHRGNFNEAFAYYSQSIDVCPNPVPYINRARILVKKIRYQEALNDLLNARRVDKSQSSEFLPEIESEIQLVQFFTENYRNGTREKLLDDFRQKSESFYDTLYIARRIFCVSFKVDREGHRPYNSPLVEYHFFNELDNVKRFESVNDYPEAEEFLQSYPDEFIQKKIQGPIDTETYAKSEAILHQFLCSYDEKDMRHLRRHIIYDIHSTLMDRDYGFLGQGMDSDCPEVIREAVEFIDQRN